MSELEELNKLIHDYEERLKILKMELVVAERKKEKEKHYKESKKIFKIIREQACDVIQGSDAWTMSEDYKRRIDMQLGKRVDNQLSILFLGGAAGEWAARTRYRGRLPGFGGFLIIANGKLILIDPGRSTFEELLNQGIHPSRLDAVIATHSHWDATRDLRLILMAAYPHSLDRTPENEKMDFKTQNGFHLYADKSVLYGIPVQDVEDDIIRYLREIGMIDGTNGSKNISDLKSLLSKFQTIEPSALNAFDLIVRLNKRFTEIEIGGTYNITPDVQMNIKRSHHSITFGQQNIPALDLNVKKNGASPVRFVYLSDTEYQLDLADQYVHDVKPIDVLIANVKTLDVLKYENGPLAGCTRKHLGWKGLIRLTEDFKNKKLLNRDSLIVLRAWGIETVTEFPKNGSKLDKDKKNYDEKVLVTNTNNLQIFEEIFHHETKMNVVIPGITWIDRTEKPASDRKFKFYIIDHVRPPFYPEGAALTFGNMAYCSKAMHEVVLEVLALIDNLTLNVLILGASGTGKDALAKDIHNVAKYLNKRKGKIVNLNARQFTEERAYSELAGFKKGAFTGATDSHKGFFEAIIDGTIVMQEVHMLAPEIQTLMLTPLSERTYIPLGSSEEKRLDAQLIFTTDHDLGKEVREGRFLDQFLFRMNRTIEIPTLKKRLEDIPVLIDHWRGHDKDGLAQMPILDSHKMSLLQSYEWPGNVRQLLNCMRDLMDSYPTSDWTYEMIKAAVDKSHRQSQGSKIFDYQLNLTEINIMEILNKAVKPLTLKEIQERLGGEAKNPKATVNHYLRHLIELGLVVQVGKAKNTRYRSNGKFPNESSAADR